MLLEPTSRQGVEPMLLTGVCSVVQTDKGVCSAVTGVYSVVTGVCSVVTGISIFNLCLTLSLSKASS